MRKKVGVKEVKAVLSAYAGHRLKELRGPLEDVSYQAVADLVGIAKPQVFDLINVGLGYGPKVERALADRFFDGSVDDFQRAAVDWWVERGDQQSIEDNEARTFRYDGLRKAVQRPSCRGRWSPSSIAAAKAMDLRANDPGEAWWVEQLDRIELALRAAALPQPTRDMMERVLGPSVADDDEKQPRDEPPPVTRRKKKS